VNAFFIFMINTKKAFTLVELIVVITILAILGTIAFISLQGYSADARNSKRTEDLNNMAGSINIKSTEGASLISFVGDTSSSLTAGEIGGAVLAAGNYNSGKPNYTALSIKESDFKDPKNVDYKIGVTTKKNGQFEIAATVENGSGENSAKITGNYSTRGANSITLDSGSGTTTGVLAATDINRVFKGDIISDGTTDLTVDKVSADGKTLTLSAALSSTGITMG